MKLLQTLLWASAGVAGIGLLGCDLVVWRSSPEPVYVERRQPPPEYGIVREIPPEPTVDRRSSPPEVVIVRAAPPAPLAERRPSRPSGEYVWIDGYWQWSGRQYVWQPGHWARPPHEHAVWVAPRYDRHEQGYRYTPGQWREERQEQPSEDAQAPPPAPLEEQPEVLTRGPVHEAFAEPINLEIGAGVVAPIEPPPNILEIPPDERPRGEQFAWVPGYWSWDGDRDAYIWVSACWRAAPQNTYWVPGYWSPVTGTRGVRRGSGWEVVVGGVVNVRIDGGRARPAEVVGWEWVAGFWMPADVEEIEYLPAPPSPVDLEPPGPPPSADRTWVPGCWYWQDGRYVRRPGYWVQARADWVWVPSHYAWTPRGYVFCRGHWDYALERRGVLFAPVYFPRSVYGRTGFTYSPSIAIDVDVLRGNLFVYPRYSHYYFGDYYDDAYARVGIYPRLESARRHTYYDPIYVQDRWQNQRTEPRWEERQKQEYDRRRDDKDLRPARTYREQETRLAKLPEPQRRAQQVPRLLSLVVTSGQSPLKFERIAPDARQTIGTQASQMYKFREERHRWEAEAEGRPEATEPPTGVKRPAGPASPREVRVTRPEKVRIPKSPIVGRPGGSRQPEFALPPTPQEERRSEVDTRGRERGSDKDKDKE